MSRVVDEFEAAFAAAKKEDSRCAVGQLIETHEAGSVIAAKIADEAAYANATISRVLKSLGIVLSSELIGKHRRGNCRCVPTTGGKK